MTHHFGPSIGTYKGRDIPDWIDSPDRGGRHVYDRIAIEDRDGGVLLAQLGDDEFVVAPGLIYKRVMP